MGSGCGHNSTRHFGNGRYFALVAKNQKRPVSVLVGVERFPLCPRLPSISHDLADYLNAGLFLSQRTDHREDNLLAVVGLEHQIEPNEQSAESNRQTEYPGDE
jgi:hypothetical protein